MGPYGLNFTLCNLILMTSAFFKCTGESGLLQIRTVGILLHFFMKQSQLKLLLCLEISFLKDKLICIFFWTSQSEKRGKEGEAAVILHRPFEYSHSKCLYFVLSISDSISGFCS